MTYCDSCGKHLRNDARFCGHCGIAVSEPIAAKGLALASTPASSGVDVKRRLVQTTFVLASMVVIVVCGTFYIRSRPNHLAVAQINDVPVYNTNPTPAEKQQSDEIQYMATHLRY